MSVLSAIQSAAQVVGGRLISGLAAGLLLAALTAVVIRAFRTSSTRFAVCFLTLVAVAFLPIASCFVSGHVTGVQSAEASLFQADGLSPFLVFGWSALELDSSGSPQDCGAFIESVAVA